MMNITTSKKGRIRRELEKRAPKLVETGKKTLILQGTKTSGLLNSVLTEIYHLKERSVRYTRRNGNVRPFESGGETSMEFFSQKTDCGMFVEKNVSQDAIQGKIGKVYIPYQQLGDMNIPNKAKGLKTERREAKMNKQANGHASKKQKGGSD